MSAKFKMLVFMESQYLPNFSEHSKFRFQFIDSFCLVDAIDFYQKSSAQKVMQLVLSNFCQLLKDTGALINQVTLSNDNYVGDIKL